MRGAQAQVNSHAIATTLKNYPDYFFMTFSPTAIYAADKMSSEIRAKGPHGDLVGTLIAPPDSKIVVLIIPGSGPTDRDGNNPLGVAAQSYKLLAEELALQGVASVRIDKRGMFASKQAVANANAVIVDDYVQDTLNWVDAIQTRMQTCRIWLMGHSEGGLIALATAKAALNDPRLCGLILLATPGRPVGQVLKSQMESNPANASILDVAIKAINTLEAGQRIQVETLPAALHTLFHPDVQNFLISLFVLDPAKLIGEIALPMLIVQGTCDLQVDVSDAARLQQHQPLACVALFPETNHLLKHVAGEDRLANMATYSDPDLPLVPHLVQTIVQFVMRKIVEQYP